MRLTVSPQPRVRELSESLYVWHSAGFIFTVGTSLFEPCVAVAVPVMHVAHTSLQHGVNGCIATGCNHPPT